MEDVLARSGATVTETTAFHLAFRSSFAVVTVWVVDRMVAFGRMISDGHRHASIHDVRVDREFEAHEIDRKIIEALLSRAPKARVSIEPAEESNVAPATLRKLGFVASGTLMSRSPSLAAAITVTESAPWAFSPLSLDGSRVRIRTLIADDIHELAEALYEPTGWFATKFGIDSIEKIQAMLREDLDAFGFHRGHPLIYHAKGSIAGFTRLTHVEAHRRTLEIAGTWVCPTWRRSFVNTEVKRLLLKHCFENLGANRVEFRVDPDNIASQKSLSKLGAALEGTLRQRQGDPNQPDAGGLVYSIIRAEWPSLELRLNSALPENPSFIL